MLLPAAERARRCTGETAVKEEAKREAIMTACTYLGTRRVAEAFGVSREVVRALRAEAIRTGKLDQIKEQAGRRALGAADAILDRLIDEVDDLPKSSLALTYGILQDKGLLLTGQPTQRIEHTVGPKHDDLNSWIELLASANPVTEGEDRGHKASGLEVVGELVEVGSGSGQTPDKPTSDSQSAVFCPSHLATQAERAELGQNQPQNGGRDE